LKNIFKLNIFPNLFLNNDIIEQKDKDKDLMDNLNAEPLSKIEKK